MPTTAIAKGASPITLINVFTVKPEDQDKLVTMLNEATEKTMRNQPGFVSANIHKSLDGLRVANYAQWRTKQDFEAMLKNAEATAHMQAIGKIATFDAHVYAVSEVHAGPART
jgi:heme-degrading monooxygenase HmoA